MESLISRLLGVVIGIFVCLITWLTLGRGSADSRVISCKINNHFLLELGPILPVFFALTTILVIPSNSSVELFQEPLSIPLADWIRHVSVVLLTSFLPGYFILRLIDKNKAIRGLLALIFSFLLSVFTVFLVGYLIILSGGTISESIFLAIVFVNVILFCSWFLPTFSGVIKGGRIAKFVFQFPKHRICKILFITCILITIFLVSYGLYGAHLIQDQRVHHGWALLYQDFLPVVDGKIDSPAPLVYPIYLATLFSSTNLPTTNALNSLNLLNALPVIAFYVMVRAYFKSRKGLPELATFFAFLTGGLGWVFAEINLIGVPSSEIASTINASWIKTYDILTSDSFLFAGHPDITTALPVIGLPCIFALVYLATPKVKLSTRLKHFLIFALTAFGLLTHPETLSVIAALTLYFAFKHDLKSNLALLTGLLFVLFLDLAAPARYYSLLTINLIGTEISLLLSGIVGVLVLSGLQIMWMKLPKMKVPVHSISSKKFALLVVCIVTYVYLLSYVIWASIVNDFNVWAVFSNGGSIPWYFYPMRLGVIGLLAIPSVVYAVLYINRAKSFLIFIFWAAAAVILAPFYLEYRMIKHLHVVLSVFAAFTLIIIAEKLHSRQRIRLFGILVIPVIIIAAIGSPLLYVEYNQTKEKDYGVLPGRIPFSSEEYEALGWLRERLNSINETVITLPRGTDNFLSEVVNLGGAWIVRTNLFYRFFNISDAQNFIKLASETNLKYIYLTKDDKHELATDNTYADCYISQLISIFPPAFNNSLVEIYEIPQMHPSTESSTALVMPASEDPYYPTPNLAKHQYNNLVQAQALAGIDYEIVPSYSLDISKYNFLILPNRPNPSKFEAYLSWTAKGNKLMLIEPQSANININEQNWTILKGVWNIDDTNFLQSNPNGSAALITQQEFSNYTAYVSLRMLDSKNEDNHMGLLLNYQNDKNWDYFFLRNNKLVLFRLRNGTGQEVWWSPAVRLENEIYNLRVNVQNATFQFYLNDVLYGIYTDDLPLNSGEIGLRTFNLIGEFNNFTIETSISDHTTSSSIPQTKLNYTSEKYGLGDIFYINFPWQILHHKSAPELWDSLNSLASIVKDLSGNPQSAVYQPGDIRDINYAMGNITFTNTTLKTSSTFIPISLTFNGDIEIFKAEHQNGALILENNYLETEMRDFNTMGQAIWEIEIEQAKFADFDGASYSVIEPNDPFKMKITLSENATLNLLVGNDTLNIKGEKYVILKVNELIWNLNSDGRNPYLLIKTPQLTSNGEIVFESAHFSKGAKDVFVKEQPLVITGYTQFNLDFTDSTITVISDLNYTAQTLVGEEKVSSNQLAVNWYQIMLSPLTVLLTFAFALILLIIISNDNKQTLRSWLS